MTKLYNIQVTEEQLIVLQDATELLTRVMLGQWREIIDWLPLNKEFNYTQFHDDCDEIGKILSKYMYQNIDGHVSSLGIGNDYVHRYHVVSYDITCSIRHKLSWERAVEKGIVESETSPRKIPEMITVDFDEPRQWSAQPLIKIERIQS